MVLMPKDNLGKLKVREDVRSVTGRKAVIIKITRKDPATVACTINALLL
jgi:hypothetical protein